MPRRPWQEWEEALMRARYSAHGAASLAKALGRTRRAVQRKAYLMGIVYGDVSTGVRLTYVAGAANVSANAVRKAAVSQGVARRIGTSKKPVYVVPHEWAERYIADRQQRRSANELEGHHYTIEDLQRMFGVSRTAVMNWLNGRGWLKEYFADVRRHRAGGARGSKILLNPYDVEEAHRRWKARRTKRRTD